MNNNNNNNLNNNNYNNNNNNNNNNINNMIYQGIPQQSQQFVRQINNSNNNNSIEMKGIQTKPTTTTTTSSNNFELNNSHPNYFKQQENQQQQQIKSYSKITGSKLSQSNQQLYNGSHLLQQQQSLVRSISSSPYLESPGYSPMDYTYIKQRYSSPMVSSPIFHTQSGLINSLPEEVIVRIFKYLNVEDLYQSYYVCSLWKRLCEEEGIFRKICYRNYPVLKRFYRPPFETSWRKYYNLRKSSFLVLGGPSSQSTCMDDICSKLRSVGIGNVDSFYAQKRIPTLEELQKYTAILIYSYNSSAFLDGQLMGDVIADYVDNGGGVVVTVFTNCNNLRNGFLKGRFLEQNYHPITPARQHDTNGKKPLSLGKIHIADHPILQGVKSLEGGRSSFFCHGALHPEAKLVAEWSNGVPLISDLEKKKGKVVALNFFPPSSDTGDPRFWSSNTDGSLMMANSLIYVGKSSVFRKNKLQSEGASYVNGDSKAKDGEGASDKDGYLKNSSNGIGSSNGTKKKHKSLSKRIPLFFKLFSKRVSP